MRKSWNNSDFWGNFTSSTCSYKNWQMNFLFFYLVIYYLFMQSCRLFCLPGQGASKTRRDSAQEPWLQASAGELVVVVIIVCVCVGGFFWEEETNAACHSHLPSSAIGAAGVVGKKRPVFWNVLDGAHRKGIRTILREWVESGCGWPSLNAQKGGRAQLGGQKYHQSLLDFARKGKQGTGCVLWEIRSPGRIRVGWISRRGSH